MKLSMNRERRIALGKVFFDLGKYILTVGVIGAFFIESIEILNMIWALIVSITILLLAYYITPKDKK